MKKEKYKKLEKNKKRAKKILRKLSSNQFSTRNDSIDINFHDETTFSQNRNDYYNNSFYFNDKNSKEKNKNKYKEETKFPFKLCPFLHLPFFGLGVSQLK